MEQLRQRVIVLTILTLVAPVLFGGCADKEHGGAQSNARHGHPDADVPAAEEAPPSPGSACLIALYISRNASGTGLSYRLGSREATLETFTQALRDLVQHDSNLKLLVFAANDVTVEELANTLKQVRKTGWRYVRFNWVLDGQLAGDPKDGLSPKVLEEIERLHGQAEDGTTDMPK